MLLGPRLLAWPVWFWHAQCFFMFLDMDCAGQRIPGASPDQQMDVHRTQKGVNSTARPGVGAFSAGCRLMRNKVELIRIKGSRYASYNKSCTSFRRVGQVKAFAA
jgi:hypothetical protein